MAIHDGLGHRAVLTRGSIPIGHSSSVPVPSASDRLVSRTLSKAQKANLNHPMNQSRVASGLAPLPKRTTDAIESRKEKHAAQDRRFLAKQREQRIVEGSHLSRGANNGVKPGAGAGKTTQDYKDARYLAENQRRHDIKTKGAEDVAPGSKPTAMDRALSHPGHPVGQHHGGPFNELDHPRDKLGEFRKK